MTNLIGSALVMLAAVCFGLMGLFRSWSHEAGVNAEMILFVRFAVAGIVLTLLMVGRGETWPRGRTLALLIFMGAGLYFGEAICWFYGLDYAPSGVISLLLYVFPAIVTVIAWLVLREKLTWTRAGAVLLALIGTALTIDPFTGFTRVQPLGIVFGLGSAVMYATYILLGTRVTQRAGALPSATIVVCSAAVAFGIVALSRGDSLPSTAAGWSGAIFLGIFSTVIAITAFLAGLQRIGAIRASTLSTLEPVVTVVIGAMLLQESFGWIQALGGGLIVIAAIIVARTTAGEQ